MACIGYARVRTIDQDLGSQIAKLKTEVCEIMRPETLSLLKPDKDISEGTPCWLGWNQ
jgi:DNA invertase Pin-like site-specific DNA recombinase